MQKLAIILIGLITIFPASELFAQEVLFDFDNAPLYASLPIDQTANGITAHLSATGQGFSIQNANVLGFTPPGFAGYIIYPNSIYLADLLIRFDQTITHFSIMYSCDELGCDDAATMRVTAYMNSSYVGTNTRTATFPGTWPVDTLSCIFPQGFDSVVVHYDSPPPTCQDYGVIFMADNMRVTPFTPTAVFGEEFPGMFILSQNYPNPFNPNTVIKYTVPQLSFIVIKVFDILGNEIGILVNEEKPAGTYDLNWNAASLPGYASGVYFYQLKATTGGGQDHSTYSRQAFIQTRKMILLR